MADTSLIQVFRDAGFSNRELVVRTTLYDTETRFEILLNGKEVQAFQATWPAHRRRFCREFTLKGAKLSLCGIFISRGGVALDLYWDGIMLPGSTSYPSTYAVPVGVIGLAHLVTGLSDGLVPAGGIAQAFGGDFGEIAFGAFLVAMAVTSWRTAGNTAKKRTFCWARRTAIASIVVDGLACLTLLALLGMNHISPPYALPIAGIAYLFPMAFLALSKLPNGIPKPAGG